MADLARRRNAQNALRVSSLVTPELDRQLALVCDRLSLPREKTDAFVTASADLQAYCISGESDGCVLSFTSALVELLSGEEFAFVCGHELGHFVFGHGDNGMVEGLESVEGYQQQRAHEISADRIGLIACNSLEIALRAIIKTTSGLSDRHLRFDFSAFLSQLQDFDDRDVSEAHNSTHPSMLLRSRALLRFSTICPRDLNEVDVDKDAVSKLDVLVSRDMERFVDGAAKRMIERATEYLELWLFAWQIVENGSFQRSDQDVVAARLGGELFEKLKTFLSSYRGSELAGLIGERIADAEESVKGVAPFSADELIGAARRSVNACFS